MAKLLKDTQLSETLGIPVSTIRADRRLERRLPFIKLGRSVLYDADECRQALDAFKVGGYQDQTKAARHG